MQFAVRNGRIVRPLKAAKRYKSEKTMRGLVIFLARRYKNEKITRRTQDQTRRATNVEMHQARREGIARPGRNVS